MKLYIIALIALAGCCFFISCGTQKAGCPATRMYSGYGHK